MNQILTTVRETEGRNSVEVVGTIIETPKYRTTAEGLYCNFEIKVPGRSEGEKETTICIKANKTLAETCMEKRLEQGHELRIVGRLVNHSKYANIVEILAWSVEPTREKWT